MKVLNIVFAALSVGLVLFGAGCLWALWTMPGDTGGSFGIAGTANIAVLRLSLAIVGSAAAVAGWVGLGLSLRRT